MPWNGESKAYLPPFNNAFCTGILVSPEKATTKASFMPLLLSAFLGCNSDERKSATTYGVLPGTPDIIIKGSKLAVFVHGCFWHGCPRHYRSPHSNLEYWSAKLRRNKARDKAVARRIRAMGWRTAVVWECQVKNNPQLVVARLVKRFGKEVFSRNS